ncbi:unnamed protein product [Mesocestoides corti]|uniref:EF-hand domain-containing protein n=2 Tax=Mesocestoides corti TaxID=53468 RepID=A0A0R3U311_MESCO|nr:unnamed protein product [Mesocestoides corti]
MTGNPFTIKMSTYAVLETKPKNATPEHPQLVFDLFSTTFALTGPMKPTVRVRSVQPIICSSLQDCVEETFAALDTDKSGKVSCAELKSALEKCKGEKIDEDVMKQFIAKFDTNKDGELSLEELRALF